LPKSFFGAVEVSYLGYGLTPQGITQGINKLKVLADTKPPNNVHHEVRQICATSSGDMSKTFEFCKLDNPE
jgi:hypothetical protein